MDYYYTDGTNQPRGPVSLAALQELAAQGTITGATLVAPVGSDHWVAANTVLGAMSAAAPGPVPAGAPNEPLAIWSLVLGILGLVCCWGIAGLPAIVCGHMALSSLRKKPGLQGRGMALAGLIMGYISVVIAILYIVFVGLMGVISALGAH